MAIQLQDDNCPTCGQQLPPNLIESFRQLRIQEFYDSIVGKGPHREGDRFYSSLHDIDIVFDGHFWHPNKDTGNI